MNGYNGFDGKERLLAWDLQKLYLANGKMDWENDSCAMCKQSDMVVMPHLENYFEVKEYKALCVECHMNLHARFKLGRGWFRYLQMLRDGHLPVKWKNVGQFFSSKNSKELFNVSQNLPIFVVSGASDIQWFEQLPMVFTDVRKGLIDQGYSETHLQEQLKLERNARFTGMDLIVDE